MALRVYTKFMSPSNFRYVYIKILIESRLWTKHDFDFVVMYDSVIYGRINTYNIQTYSVSQTCSVKLNFEDAKI